MVTTLIWGDVVASMVRHGGTHPESIVLTCCYAAGINAMALALKNQLVAALGQEHVPWRFKDLALGPGGVYSGRHFALPPNHACCHYSAAA